MGLVNTKKMLQDAQKGMYAVGAFNVENMEMAQAIIAAAEELKSPVILQTTPSTIKYATPLIFASMVSAVAESATVPVAIHLDHGNSYELAVQCMDDGYKSVMIDGSHESYEDNIAVTQKVVEEAQKRDISVEAELGKIGGKEDDLDGGEGDGYTDPKMALDYVTRTGIDSLAVAIGTAHGFYKSKPKLDKDRLVAIRELVDIPLVLHGASGLVEQDMRDCVERGINKINFATELRFAFTKGVNEYMAKDKDVFDPKKYNAVGREYVKNLVKEKILICGSNGKAE